MKFLKKDGTIEEGIPLTDRGVTIELLVRYLHAKVCYNAYHGTYGKKPCVEAANFLVSKLNDSAMDSIRQSLSVPYPEPEPVSDSQGMSTEKL